MEEAWREEAPLEEVEKGGKLGEKKLHFGEDERWKKLEEERLN